ncbi:T9SS type A sorting domain-containing protein [bacterium]|nr:T9SS type A sorting domain-containing protein [bacterium]
MVNACIISVPGGEGTLDVNTEIYVPINLSRTLSENVVAFQLDVEFASDQIILDNITRTTLAQNANKDVSYNLIVANKIRIIIHGLGAEVIPSGTIANIIFKPSGTAVLGQTDLIVSQTVACDVNAVLIPSTSENGLVVLSEELSPTPEPTPEPSETLSDLKIYPNPFKPALGHVKITFENLTANTQIRIYSITGNLVKKIIVETSGIAEWDGITDQGKMVAQGVYFYQVTNKSGKKCEGKITIVQ